MSRTRKTKGKGKKKEEGLDKSGKWLSNRQKSGERVSVSEGFLVWGVRNGGVKKLVSSSGRQLERYGDVGERGRRMTDRIKDWWSECCVPGEPINYGTTEVCVRAQAGGCKTGRNGYSIRGIIWVSFSREGLTERTDETFLIKNRNFEILDFIWKVRKRKVMISMMRHCGMLSR